MYVVAMNRKAAVGYKKVTGRVDRILPGRGRIGLFGRQDTGKCALISLGEDRYTGTVGDGVKEGEAIGLYVFPDRAVYSSLPEGDVWDIDEGVVPDGKIPVKDSRGVRRVYWGKYGLLALELAGCAVISLVIGSGLAPMAGWALLAAVCVQCVWATFANGPAFRLYQTDTKKLTHSGRKAV